jgi:hypothetical protein
VRTARRRALVRGHHDRRNERDPRPPAGPRPRRRAHSTCGNAYCPSTSDVPIHAIADGISMRISAHAYNQIEDYKRLAEILRAIR